MSHQYAVTIEWPGMSTEVLYFTQLEDASKRAKAFGFKIVAVRGKRW